MAKATYWQRGDALDYTNGGSAKIEANEVIVFGTKIGVAGTDIAVGELGSLIISGIFEMPKDYGDSGKALTAGQEVYWDAVNGCIKAAVAQVVAEGAVTTEASAVHGFAVAAAASADQTALIKINA